MVHKKFVLVIIIVILVTASLIGIGILAKYQESEIPKMYTLNSGDINSDEIKLINNLIRQASENNCKGSTGENREVFEKVARSLYSQEEAERQIKSRWDPTGFYTQCEIKDIQFTEVQRLQELPSVVVVKTTIKEGLIDSESKYKENIYKDVFSFVRKDTNNQWRIEIEDSPFRSGEEGTNEFIKAVVEELK